MLRTDRRQALWKTQKAAHQRACAAFVVAHRAALDAFEQVIDISAQTRRQGFEFEVSAFPIPPQMLNRSLIAQFEEEVERFNDMRAQAPAQRPVAPRVTPAQPQPLVKVAAAAPTPRPKRPRRVDQAKDGERLVLILTSGYETLNGQQCVTNDIVALPNKVAQTVVSNGAGEFYSGASEAAQ